MRGKRIATVRYRARHLSSGRKTSRHRNCHGAEEGAALKFVICGVIFVLIVAMKLLFPQAIDGFGRSAMQLIGSDADFKEAFAAIGRAASGEEAVSDSLLDAYAAVFNPSAVAVEREAEQPLSSVNVEPSPATKTVSEIKLNDVNEMRTEDKTNGEQSIETETEPMLPTLPENASMEHRNLGFSCVTPVRGTLTSGFGWREHPVVGDLRYHYGVDLAAENGTEILAFADGEVFATGESSTLGTYIILIHPGGYRTLYGHCSKILKSGGSVSMGEVIATVGDSGMTTGSHLHFELQNGTVYLNPIYYVEIG